jgi:spore germination protein YaaH
MNMANLEYIRKKPPKELIVTGLIFAFVFTFSIILLLLYPFASKEQQTYFQGKNPIIFQGKQAGNALMEENTLYVPLSFMKENLDETIAFDEKSNSIIITTAEKVVQMPTESLTYYVNEQPVQLHIPPLQAKDGELYIALNPVLAYYPVQFKILKETGAVWIQKDGDQYTKAAISSKKEDIPELKLRIEPTLQSPYTAGTHSKQSVTIEGEKNGYYFVRQENGIAGYIQKKFVKKGEKTIISIQHRSEPSKLTKIDGPIQLTWEAVYQKNPNHSNIPEMAGINVVSPTWFKLNGNDGSIANLASLEYSNWAKQRGYQVWALFSNDFNPELTHEAFKDFETRQKIIRQLLHFAQMYSLNGINFDIENVDPKDGPLVTQLLREATPYLHEAGLTVSVDITFISTSGYWSAFYERDQLAKIVDYMVVMAYDEHWGTSPVSGSVASFPWVEQNLQKLLEVVPSESLILGVPLYARLWKEQMMEDQTIKVTSEAMSMEKVKQWLAEKALTPSYDDKSGQNYAEYYAAEEKTTYKIWIEDELSLKKRADLANEYGLAGVASWSRFFGDDSAWTALKLTPNDEVTKK